MIFNSVELFILPTANFHTTVKIANLHTINHNILLTYLALSQDGWDFMQNVGWITMNNHLTWPGFYHRRFNDSFQNHPFRSNLEPYLISTCKIDYWSNLLLSYFDITCHYSLFLFLRLRYLFVKHLPKAMTAQLPNLKRWCSLVFKMLDFQSLKGNVCGFDSTNGGNHALKAISLLSSPSFRGQ